MLFTGLPFFLKKPYRNNECKHAINKIKIGIKNFQLAARYLDEITSTK